jgi:glycosyltransferase involved in cell wall biosynthesis
MSERDGGSPSLVSCLMVTRNRAALSQQAVDCFAAQTWPCRELVIIDDGEQDYTPFLEPYVRDGHAIRYLRRREDPSLRLGALRNASIDAALGPWCMQWDDDEWYHPERISTQMAAVGDAAGVALRWTLVSVGSARHGDLVFRADAGIATPGTILHRRDAARYPNLGRGEDSAFLRDVRSAGGLNVLGRDASHLFVRCFHGSNTWSEDHFLRRLHRRPVDWPTYAMARWWYRDLHHHRAFTLDARESESIASLQRRSSEE